MVRKKTLKILIIGDIYLVRNFREIKNPRKNGFGKIAKIKTAKYFLFFPFSLVKQSQTAEL